MKQYEQVVRIMEENGGYATLGYLNQHTDVSSWKTKTPFATIRRIVQDPRFFFKIKPGLWALKSHREIVLKKFDLVEKDKDSENIFNHTYYQGLIAEIGNLKGRTTFIPNQDKNRMFLDRPLGLVASLREIYQFTYSEIVKRAKTVDVIWFNERKFPHAFFEIEHSTEFHNSLAKYHDLQDFNSQFYIVGPIQKKRRYEEIINRNLYKTMRDKIKLQYWDYDFVSNLHTKTYEYTEIQKEIEL